MAVAAALWRARRDGVRGADPVHAGAGPIIPEGSARVPRPPGLFGNDLRSGDRMVLDARFLRGPNRERRTDGALDAFALCPRVRGRIRRRAVLHPARQNRLDVYEQDLVAVPPLTSRSDRRSSLLTQKFSANSRKDRVFRARQCKTSKKWAHTWMKI